jgi:hypothetical protein
MLTYVTEINKNSDYLLNLLEYWFNLHYANADGPIADNIRRAICWLDEALFLKSEGGDVE